MQGLTGHNAVTFCHHATQEKQPEELRLHQIAEPLLMTPAAGGAAGGGMSVCPSRGWALISNIPLPFLLSPDLLASLLRPCPSLLLALCK